MSAEEHRDAAPDRCACLTRREREVLAALATGGGTAAIAQELGLSERTVRNYMSQIYLKVGASNRVQAMLWWQRHEAAPDTCGVLR